MRKRYILILSLLMMLNGCGKTEDVNNFQQTEIIEMNENIKDNQEKTENTDNNIYQTKYVTLKKIGEFANDEKIDIYDGEIFIKGSIEGEPREEYQVCDYLGNPIDMTNYYRIWNDFIIRYKYDEESGNKYMGIDDMNGNVLVPSQAVAEIISGRYDWCRYVAFVSKEDYSAKIFDFKEKKFIDTLNINTQEQEFGFSDDLIWIRKNGDYIFYNSQGEYVGTTDYMDVGMFEDEVGHIDGDFIIRGSEVYDADGNFLFSFSTDVIEIRNVPGDDKFIRYRDYNQYGIVDSEGNIIAKGEFVFAHGNGIYTVDTEEKEILLIGDYVVPDDVWFNRCKYGVQTGRFVKNEDVGFREELWILESKEFVSYPGEKIDFRNNERENSWGFVEFEKEDNYKKGLRECFSGEIVLPGEYDRIKFCYDRVYALKDEKWSIFEVVDFDWPDLSEDGQQRIGSKAVEQGESVNEISEESVVIEGDLN